MAGETTTTSLNDLIHTEQIEKIILDPHRPASIHQLVAWLRDASKGGSGVYQFPKWAKTDIPAGLKTEGTGGFTITEQTTTSVTCTAGYVGIGRSISDEAEQDAMVGLPALMLLNEGAGNERLTKDMCSLFTSADNTTNVGNAAFTLTQWGIAKAGLKAQNPTGLRLAAVLSNAAMRDLEADMRDKGSSIMANPLYIDGKLINNPGQGFKGFFEGLEVYETGLCPDNDADTISSAMLVVGDRGAIGLAVWKPWQHEVRRNPENATNELFTSARYAFKIADQDNLREIISQD